MYVVQSTQTLVTFSHGISLFLAIYNLVMRCNLFMHNINYDSYEVIKLQNFALCYYSNVGPFNLILNNLQS